MPRLITVLTSSGCVQWLRCSGGVSHATANNWQICSAVKIPGQPGRGLSASKRLTASRNCFDRPVYFTNSMPAASQRFRQNPTVSSHIPSRWLIILLLSPAWADNTICARCTRLCGASRLRAMVSKMLCCSELNVSGDRGRAKG